MKESVERQRKDKDIDRHRKKEKEWKKMFKEKENGERKGEWKKT